MAANGSGVLQVAYRSERPDADEGPFLAEERALKKGLSSGKGKYKQYTDANKKLHNTHKALRELIARLPAELKADPLVALASCGAAAGDLRHRVSPRGRVIIE